MKDMFFFSLDYMIQKYIRDANVPPVKNMVKKTDFAEAKAEIMKKLATWNSSEKAVAIMRLFGYDSVVKVTKVDTVVSSRLHKYGATKDNEDHAVKETENDVVKEVEYNAVKQTEEPTVIEADDNAVKETEDDVEKQRKHKRVTPSVQHLADIRVEEEEENGEGSYLKSTRWTIMLNV